MTIWRGLGGWPCRLAAGVLVLAAIAAPAARTDARDAPGTTEFRATYAITLAGTVIGKAAVEARFTGDDYSATIKGSTTGLSRMVSDGSATLSGSGVVDGKRVLPSVFALDTMESGFGTRVRLVMKSGRVIDVVAEPPLPRAADRIPVTPRHKIDVVDPLGAFLVPLDRAALGRQACNRRINVFDGWTRFDVELTFKGMKAVDGGSDTYAGEVVVCGARAYPVSGHRLGGSSIAEIVDSTRSEIWLAPVGKTGLLVPYRIVMGTRWGDIAVFATRFTAKETVRRAALP